VTALIEGITRSQQHGGTYLAHEETGTAFGEGDDE
jgi:hypothetical protein